MSTRAITGYLILAAWFSWFCYWRISARHTKPIERRESRASRAAHIAPMLIGAALLLMRTIPGGGLLFRRLWAPSAGIDAVAVALVVAGLAFSVWARAHLGSNWSGTVTVKQGHALIRTGPYALLRHPIYTGLLLGFIGTALWRDQWRAWLAVLIVVAALWYKLRLEERWMGETFGELYAQYRHQTYALIPYVL